MTISISKVGQIGIPVKNVDRAISFYHETLGLSLLFQTDTMAFLESNGLRILLSLPEKEEYATASSVVYFQVDDIEDTYDQLAKKKVVFRGEPHVVSKMGNVETWMVFFYDTEGNTHAFISEVEGNS
ncbi:VOC family protein [Mangrovibacillus cuniculi]|uniref:VOC family protein n=1 Tax=Mangrovibacillus cuniculi TaxID=2593652 RepID=A0A7S8HGK2_9BACI|nr:VOC family protein [Mangrovibacillus cuniculi]QPC47887.1 VOC family protein [Mangrovibacillus cuniculi]